MSIEDPLSVRELLGAGDEEAELGAQTAEAEICEGCGRPKVAWRCRCGGAC